VVEEWESKLTADDLVWSDASRHGVPYLKQQVAVIGRDEEG
jgi:hypothetical protein